MYLAIFAFVGVFNLAFAQWDPEILTTAEYWISTLTTSFTYVMAFQITVNLAADIMSESNEEFNQLETEIRKFGRTNVHPDFSDFIHSVNWISKRDTWKTMVMNELIEINDKVSQSMLDEIKADDPTKQSTKTREYLYKKARLEEQLTDEWIEANLRYKKIRYPVITPNEVITGEKKPYNTTKVIDNSVGMFALTRRVGMLGVMVVINGLMEALIFTGNPFNVATLMLILFQIFMVFVNIFSGWVAGIDGFRKKRLNSAYIRRDLLVAYAGWRKNKDAKIDLDFTTPKQLKEVQNETN